MGLFSSCFGDSEPEHTRRARHRRRVTKAMIGTPKNFIHTGHLGIGSLHDTKHPAVADPERFKIVMSQVGAALDDDMFRVPRDGPKRATASVGMAY